MQNARYWINKLGLLKHPEGGWYKEVYRSEDSFAIRDTSRNASTSIYYLLEGNDFSALHRIQSDEIWHYYMGDSPMEIVWIEDNNVKVKYLGQNFEKGEHFQVCVPKRCWFGARLGNPTGYALVGCTVAPGFHFDDFEMAGKEILEEYTGIKETLRPFLRG